MIKNCLLITLLLNFCYLSASTNYSAEEIRCLKIAEKTHQSAYKQFEYENDLKTWGQLDYWATGQEMMKRGKGDCEDFALVVYEQAFLNYCEKYLEFVFLKAKEGVEDNHLNLRFIFNESNSPPLYFDGSSHKAQSQSDYEQSISQKYTPSIRFNLYYQWPYSSSVEIDSTDKDYLEKHLNSWLYKFKSERGKNLSW